jgi:hypothetical protein
MTHDEMIEVIQAHKDGKVIQLCDCRSNWIDMPRTPDWNFNAVDYRVKPDPKKYRVPVIFNDGKDFGWVELTKEMIEELTND